MISQTGARLDYNVTLLTDRTPTTPGEGPATSRRTCSGGDVIDIKLSKTGGEKTLKQLAKPRGLKEAKVSLPKLAELGAEGLVVTATPKKAGGTLEVDVRLADGSDDPFKIGSKSLGDAERGLKAGKRSTLKVPVKGTLGTPDASDSVKLEITLTFTPDGKDKGTSKTTVVRVPT